MLKNINGEKLNENIDQLNERVSALERHNSQSSNGEKKFAGFFGLQPTPSSKNFNIDTDVRNPPRPYTPIDLKTDISPIGDMSHTEGFFFGALEENGELCFNYQNTEETEEADNEPINPFSAIKKDSLDRERFSYSRSEMSQNSGDKSNTAYERLRIPSFQQCDLFTNESDPASKTDRLKPNVEKKKLFGIDLELLNKTDGPDPQIRNKISLSQRKIMTKKVPNQLRQEFMKVFEPKSKEVPFPKPHATGSGIVKKSSMDLSIKK
jgi:hypothetical protein